MKAACACLMLCHAAMAQQPALGKAVTAAAEAKGVALYQRTRACTIGKNSSFMRVMLQACMAEKARAHVQRAGSAASQTADSGSKPPAAAPVQDKAVGQNKPRSGSAPAALKAQGVHHSTHEHSTREHATHEHATHDLGRVRPAVRPVVPKPATKLDAQVVTATSSIPSAAPSQMTRSGADSSTDSIHAASAALLAPSDSLPATPASPPLLGTPLQQHLLVALAILGALATFSIARQRRA